MTGCTLGGPSPEPQTARRRVRSRVSSTKPAASAGQATADGVVVLVSRAGRPATATSGGSGGSDDHQYETNVHAEWQVGNGGYAHGMEVEVREDSSTGSPTLLANNTTNYPLAEGGSVVIVRAEEVLLVALVLIIWVAAIALFINRWGKIRMLEPYQPKFQNQNHRPSCPMAPLSPPHITSQQRMSFSKYNVNCFDTTYSGFPSPSIPRRGRLNSVFVGGSGAAMSYSNLPRRAKSAMDIQHLILNEGGPGGGTTSSSSMLPFLRYEQQFHGHHQPHHLLQQRKSSIIAFDHQYHPQHRVLHHQSASATSATGNSISAVKHRPSMASERPLLAHYAQFRNRRSSCAVDRSTSRHRNFISFEQPKRKGSMSIDRPSKSYQGPTISFEMPPSSHDTSLVSSTATCSASTSTTSTITPAPPPPPTVIVERPSGGTTMSVTATGHRRRVSTVLGMPVTSIAPVTCKMSRSFEQPPTLQRLPPPPPRMCTSLDAYSLGLEHSTNKQPQQLQPSNFELAPDRASPVIITLEGTQISAPLFDSLKSSDV